jgi:hypothetical protein
MINKIFILTTVLVLGSATTAYSHEDELMSHIGSNTVKSITYSAWCNDAETLLIVGSDFDNDGEIDSCFFIKNAHGSIHVGDAPQIYGKCECILPKK